MAAPPIMGDSRRNLQPGAPSSAATLDGNGVAVTGTSFFGDMESLATAAHAQAQQQPTPSPVAYGQPAAAQQGMVDPMFYLNDPQQQSQSQQPFYATQGYAPPPPQQETMYPSADQLRHSLQQQLGGGDFQQLMGQIGYQGASREQDTLAMQQQRIMAAQYQHLSQQQYQQLRQLQQGPLPRQQYVRQNLGLPQQQSAVPVRSLSAQHSPLLVQQPNPPVMLTASSGVSSPQTESTDSTKLSALSIRTVPDQTLTKKRTDFRPKTSIPQDLTAEEYASQCIQAAIASRLSPYHLHNGEYKLLRDHISHVQVTIYLHIRNGVLRLWQRNPLVSVTREEAAGCAKDYRFFDVAEMAYDWLVRNGYINYGCIEVPNTILGPASPAKRQKTVVVIGAGMAGLGCARQLEGLFSQFGDKLPPDELPPKVVILEGRDRIGGRVYSHPLHDQSASSLPLAKRATADLGAQVITGFENGNPLNILVRGQLALEYHSLKDNEVLFDSDGTIVSKERDTLVEMLFNHMLDRVSAYKQRPRLPKTIGGDRELIDNGKDPTGESGESVAAVEANEVDIPAIDIPHPATDVDPLTGKPSNVATAEQVGELGWELKSGITGEDMISLEPQGPDPQFPTLGKTMDAAIQKYQEFLSLTPLDFRLINWHYANLEYANASTVDALSLGHWDQDDGHEPAGPHSVLLGGYTQVPRGLLLAPTELDIKPRHTVKKITFGLREGELSKVECENGAIIKADRIVVTLPLGVLKAGDVEFEPALPDWKVDAIRRMGYGLLNKVVLVFDEPFWDVDNDMVGVLRNPVGDPLQQQSYEANRGRFYMFWNAMKQSGKPVLISLMAGEAAVQTESGTDEDIIDEAIALLQKMYPAKVVPAPTETIITRWGKDPFSRGSYSYVGQQATAEDYDLMAKPVGDNLYFAGEATCKSHPATVHGAYISGLRAAAEVVESILGPIQPPCKPLIPPKPKLEMSYSGTTSRKRKAEESAIEKARELKTQRLEAHEKAMNDALVAALGERPSKPGRSGANPFLLYQKDHWYICKTKCDEARRKATNNPEAKATRNDVRAALGQMWRDAPETEKRPYLAETERNKESNAAGLVDFKKKIKDWDITAAKFKKEWKEKNVSIPSEEEKQATRQAELEKKEIKRSRKMNGYAEDSEDEGY